MQPGHEQRQLYEEGVEQYADSIYRVAYRLTGHHELARELVQETYLAAWRGISNLKNPGAIRAWFFGILRNQFSKQLGREKRNQYARYEQAGLIDGAEIHALSQSDPAQQAELVDSVQLALGRLDDDQRLPVLLVTMEGWSTEEAAEFLEIPKGTVLSRLHRGRQRLKKLLTEWEVENL